MFFEELSETELEKLREYLEKGKQMDKRRILFLLVDMYMEYCGISAAYRTVVYDLGWEVFRQYASSEQTEFTGEEAFYTVMSRLNPEYTEEYDEYDIILLEDKNYPTYCMDILAEHDYDAEKCAAICYGLYCMMLN